MREIPLTKGKVAIVDDEDFEELSKYKWYFTNNGYAGRRVGNVAIYMHRQILYAPKGLLVDHINHDRLDNRRENIRICTHKENLRNRGKQRNNTSGYNGVGRTKEGNRWRAYIKVDGKMCHLGHFKCKHDAARMHNFWAADLFGEFAYLNKITEDEGE